MILWTPSFDWQETVLDIFQRLQDRLKYDDNSTMQVLTENKIIIIILLFFFRVLNIQVL